MTGVQTCALRSTRQKKMVVGIVTDQRKIPMPGVTVKIFGTNIGTATNAKGQFSLILPMEKGALEFSFVGYKSQKVNFTGVTKDSLRVVMEEDIQALDEAVVVAYGTTNKREMTGAVSVVKAEELQGIPSSDIASLLQGRVAGLDITNMSGAPGGGGTAITIRGYNSLNVEQGRRFSDPLWVVDGVPLNSFSSPITGTNLLADINPDMIESVQILKDASSASIYGSRAANGVIIVTTKKGRKNQKATFSVNASQSWGVVAHKLKMDDSKFYKNMEHYGNTSSASVPMALNELNEKGLIQRGDKIILTGFGGGMTWGTMLVEW